MPLKQTTYPKYQDIEYPSDLKLKEECPEKQEDIDCIAAEETVSKRGS